MTPGTPFPHLRLKFKTRREALAAQEALSFMQKMLTSHADVLVRTPPTVSSTPDISSRVVEHFVDTRFGVRPPIGEPAIYMMAGGVFPVVEKPRASLAPGVAHFMIDLETLGRRAGCQVLSLGAVQFGPDGLGDEFYANFTTDDQAAVGLVAEPDTVAWWARQSPEAKAALEEHKRPVRHVLIAFRQWLLNRSGSGRIWGNGASFDEPILLALHDAFLAEPPWKYKYSRCFRTLRAMHANIPWAAGNKLPHHALEDAKSQALQAIAILNVTDGWATV